MAKHTDAKPEKADEKEKADEEEKANEKEEKEKEAEHSEEYYQQWLEHIPPIDFAVVDDSESDSESVSNVEEEDVKGGEQMLEGLVEESKITEGAQIDNDKSLAAAATVGGMHLLDDSNSDSGSGSDSK